MRTLHRERHNGLMGLLIVNIASMAGLRVVPQIGAHSMSKPAVIAAGDGFAV